MSLVRHHVAILGLFVVVLAIPEPSAAASKPAAAGADAWPEITPAEKSLTKVDQDPEADAVVLINDRNGKIVQRAEDWVNVLDYHWRIKILNDRGKRYADVHLPAEKLSRILNIRARTVKDDGTILPVAPDQIFEKLLYQVGDLKVTEWVFKFPAVERGAILEYRYDRYDNFLVFVDPWYFAGPEFTLLSRLTQVIPNGMTYSILCDLCGGAKPEVKEWREAKAKGQMYSIELRNVPGYREELMMPPARDVTPRMEMVMQGWKDRRIEALGRQDNLFTDWASVAKYASFYYQQAIKAGQVAIKPVVDEWTKGLSDPQEKIKAITRHVQQDFRYLDFYRFVTLSPDPIDKLLKNKAADNAEKAVLLMAALKAIGVDSHAAQVSGKAGGSLNPKFFSPTQFTHAIVGLPQADGTYQWIDPTVSYAPFGFVPWTDSGAGALLLKGDQGELITLGSKAELSASRYKLSVKPRADLKADIEAEAEYIGEDAIEMRDDLAPISESDRKSYLQAWVAERRPDAVLKSFSIEDIDAMDKPLRIKMSIEAPGLVTRADDVLLVRACVLNCYDTNPLSRANRQHPFYIDRGWSREETVVIVPPSGMIAAQMPPPAAAKSVIGSLSLGCTSQSDGGARCWEQFTVRRNRWPADQNGSIRAMYDKIVEAGRMTVALQKAEAAPAGR
ncbi:MAG TPA: DUF3857 and transglutaminase domain-containing protein [Candidatus Polarisedimenticolia bacterium]|jgi:hypothetical protein|nr:DUF3857 and transglutaminase domain-containing protein [Candidatus Polarisedimenticolia bacterium]